MLQRLAIALGVVFLLGAAAATFAPASSGRADCGTWVSPEYDQDQVDQVVQKAQAARDSAASAGIDTSELNATILAVSMAASACDSALDGRRTWSLALLGLAVVAPIATLFVGGHRD